MTDDEKESYQREIRQLHARLDALASDRAAEIINIRDSLHALERRLSPPVRRTFTAPTIPQEATPTPPPMVVQETPAQRVEQPATPVPWVDPAPTPKPKAAPLPLPAESRGSFELRFGRIWLVRLGIALLVTGLVLLGNFAYKNWIRDLPAIVRLAALYLGSFAMCGAGLYLGARESMRRFSDVLLAGGLAFFYWCTFAAHHVPRLQVIESPITAGVLLLGAAGAIVGVSLRRESRVTATMGLLLASYSTILQPLGWLSATSNVVLAIAGTAFMRRPGWSLPGIASMAGTYLSFFWWQIAGGHGGRPDDPSALWFLPPVWAVFALPGV